MPRGELAVIWDLAVAIKRVFVAGSIALELGQRPGIQ
jgi:hypothetical protein